MAKHTTGAPLTRAEAGVLLALVTLDEPSASTAIHRRLNERTGGGYQHGSVHAVLRRLEALGWLTTTLTDPLPRKGGRRRSLYALTAAGDAALAATLDELDALRAGTRFERTINRSAAEAEPVRRPASSAIPPDDQLDAILKGLTWNAAWNLRETVVSPHERFPDLLNGGRRIVTGLGKWTAIAARGVEANLIKLGLIAPVWLPWNGEDREKGWESPCLTALGRAVAEHVHDHWDTLTFRDRTRQA